MFKNKIRSKDFISLLIIFLLYVPSQIFKLLSRKIFIFSERPNEARDNGYALFSNFNDKKYKKYYLISKKSFDVNKIDKKYRLYYGTLKHYFIFLASSIRLSSQVNTDSPNFRVTNFLDRHKIICNRRIFLQHGITKDKISFGYYSVSNADMFICAAKPEYEFVKKEFGYPDGSVVLTGFPRYDTLIDEDKNYILVMPTWRSWLANSTEDEFMNSDFYKNYIQLIESKKVEDLLEKNATSVFFYLHHDLQRFAHLFKENKLVHICSEAEYDVQTLLKEAKLLITDYSSVAFDFCYMKKPVIYYQFDYKEYRSKQHCEGYFDYMKNGFGPIANSFDELLSELKTLSSNSFIIGTIYEQRLSEFFEFSDKNNCSRVLKAIFSKFF